MLQVGIEISDYLTEKMPELRGVFLESDEFKGVVPAVVVSSGGMICANSSPSDNAPFRQTWQVDLLLPRHRTRDQASDFLTTITRTLHNWRPESASCDLKVDTIEGPMIEEQYTGYRVKFGTLINVILL